MKLGVDGQSDDVDQFPDRLGDLPGGIAEQRIGRVRLTELVVQGQHRRGAGALTHRLGRALGLGDRAGAQPVPSDLVADLPGIDIGKRLDEGIDPGVPGGVSQGCHVVGVADLGQGQTSLRVQGLHRGAPASHLLSVAGITDHQAGRHLPLPASRTVGGQGGGDLGGCGHPGEGDPDDRVLRRLSHQCPVQGQLRPGGGLQRRVRQAASVGPGLGRGTGVQGLLSRVPQRDRLVSALETLRGGLLVALGLPLVEGPGRQLQEVVLAGGGQIRHEGRVPMTGGPRHGQRAVTPGGHIDTDGAVLILIERPDGDDLQGLGVQQGVVVTGLALTVGLDATQRLQVEDTALRVTDVEAQVGGCPVAHSRWRSHMSVTAGGH